MMAHVTDEIEEPQTYDVFISYAHRDEREYGYAKELATGLRAQGVTVWYDKELIDDAGADWHGAITKKMIASTIIVALWSKLALSRPMCRFEATFASGMDKLFPVGLEDIGPADFTEELHGLTYRLNRVEWNVATLVDMVATRLKADEVAAERRALRRKLAPAPPSAALLAQERIDLSAVLTSGSGFLAGREAEERLLDDAWASCAPDAPTTETKTNIVVLHAIGGAGKTALLRRLVDRLSEADFPYADKVLGWSAYSQGSGESRNADSDAFVIDALRFMGELGGLPRDSVQRARLLAARLRTTRTLLLLDGIEPLQSTPDVDNGRLKDKGLQRLVQDLALGHPGLVVITSRQHLPELEKGGVVKPGVRSHALDQLTHEAGVEVLRHLRCWGSVRDMAAAVDEAQGHALTITLLGSYIDAVEAGDIARRDHLGLAGIIDTAEELAVGDQTMRLAKRVGAIMRAYIDRFEALEKAGSGKGEAERMLLSIVGLFDRPADGAAVRALLDGESIPGLTDVTASRPPHERATRINAAKSRLRELKLLGEADEDDSDGFDAHPVVRAYFGAALKEASPDAFRAAHERLYRHYAAAPDLPESLVEMQPLFHAIGHACTAGLHQEAFDDVYFWRVLRGNESFINKQLGAYAAGLGALAHFFDPPWAAPSSALTAADRAVAMGYASFALRALGRLVEAEAPTAAGLALNVQQEDWRNAAGSASNLSQLRLAIGRVAEAIEAGSAAIDHADRSGNAFKAITTRVAHADALSQGGRWDEAQALFAEAEARQPTPQPELPRLYSLRGYQYCDHLLDRGAAADVRERAKWTLRFYANLDDPVVLLDRGLVALADASALTLLAAHGDADAARAAGRRLDEAVTALRVAGNDRYLPLGLLARAGLRRQAFARSGDPADLTVAAEDLSEVDDIASRGSMKLYLADWCLELARLCLAQIPGAPPEALVPLTEEVEVPVDPAPAAPARKPALLARLFGRKPAPPAEPAKTCRGWRVVSTGPTPPPPRTEPLAAEEQRLLAEAQEHADEAAKLIKDTGYHRRDRERDDLSARLDALAALR